MKVVDFETTLQRIRWKDTGEECNYLFGIGDYDGEDDDQIFFWVESMQEIKDNNFDEFTII